MTGQEFKHLTNEALDAAGPMTFTQRQLWWVTPQGGVKEPWMLVVDGSDEDRLAVLEAAKKRVA